MIKDVFGKNLHKALSERGIKQVELSRAIDVPPTTVNGWIRGAHLPDLETLQAICDYLKMPVVEILGGKEKEPHHKEPSIVFEDLLLEALKRAGVKEVTIKF